MPDIKRKAYATIKNGFAVAGFNLTRRHFYSPIPDSISEADWAFKSPMRGISMDLDRQLQWIEQTAHHVGEFEPPIAVGPSYTFTYPNGSFGNGDADVLYGAIRSLKPSRIVELGSGHTSVVMRLALERNAAEGVAYEYDVYDPFPTDYLAGTSMAFRPRALPAEQVPDEVFTDLGPGDFLFVDTTHTVKLGGDVNRLVLEALPLLAQGVIVHFHDIFLPYPYPRSFFEEDEFYWAEQYLLQAFLAYNQNFTVLAGLHALARDRPTQFGQLIPSMARAAIPGSFWLQRT